MYLQAAQNAALFDAAAASDRVIGRSRAIRRILDQVAMVAATEATVLLLGESGTGKELIAREIQELGRRAGRAFVRVNCSAIPRELFESEFFGHARGAFTGAVRERAGRFQLADGGTIFLDEIGDLPLELQPKLLRVLQEGQYERLGENVTRQVDVRVVAATNHDLEALVRCGRFREDLFYRISVFPVHLPPLRARRDDIPVLALHFVAASARKLGVAPPKVSIDSLERLKHHDWPGNVRELQNVIERAVILARGGRVDLEAGIIGAASTPGCSSRDTDLESAEPVIADREWRRRERANMLAALRRGGGRISGAGGAAALLGVKPSTLASRLKSMGIRTQDARQTCQRQTGRAAIAANTCLRAPRW